MARHAVVHGVVHEEHVVPPEGELRRVGDQLGDAVEHGAHVVGVARLVLDHVVLVRVVLDEEGDLLGGLGELVGGLLGGGGAEVDAVVLQDLLGGAEAGGEGGGVPVFRKGRV